MDTEETNFHRNSGHGLKGPDDFESAFKTAKSGGAEALIVISNPLSNTHRARIVDLAAKESAAGNLPID